MKHLKGNIQEIAIDALAYPDELRRLEEPPTKLFAVGDVSLLQQTEHPRMCLFGARRCSAETKKVAAHFTETALNHGCVVVNGGAIGIDTAVLEEAVAHHAKAVVFLASITDVYPRQNAELFQQVVDLGGVVVSPNDDITLPVFFKQRTKHMLAFSDAAFVIEAGTPSCTVSNAFDALEAGKPVWAYPSGQGCFELIRAGAPLVATSHHFNDELQKL